jgi:outer membrane protein OmpA-like peptidoglycan-associated protein
LNFTGGIRFRGEGDSVRWNASFYAGYTVLGGQDFTYTMYLKSAEEEGKMEIKPNYESDIFGGAAFGIEASMGGNLFLYAGADAKFMFEGANKTLGYGANAGIKVRFGAERKRPKPVKPAPPVKEEPEPEGFTETYKNMEMKQDIDIGGAMERLGPSAQRQQQDFSSLDGLDEESLAAMLENLEKEVIKKVSAADQKMIDEAKQRRLNLIKSFRLSAAVFKSGSAELTEDSRDDIMKLAQSLKNYDYNKITVEGHTDSTGQAEQNRFLSFERAKSVYLELIRNGVPKEKLDYAGFGAMMPISSNKTEVGKRQNRRVEIFVEGENENSGIIAQYDAEQGADINRAGKAPHYSAEDQYDKLFFDDEPYSESVKMRSGGDTVDSQKTIKTDSAVKVKSNQIKEKTPQKKQTVKSKTKTAPAAKTKTSVKTANPAKTSKTAKTAVPAKKTSASKVKK